MNEFDAQRVKEIIELMRGQLIVVFGDVMLDEFVWGEVTRISPEAPVPVVDVRRESWRLGGAANVFANVAALGGRGAVVGVTGTDAAGERLREELAQAGALDVTNTLVSDVERPTTVKTRIIAHNQLVVRADRELRTPVGRDIETQLIERIMKLLNGGASALLVSDYDKGAVTGRVLEELIAAARERKVPVLVDPKIKNFASYRHATLVTPNHHEALRLANIDEDTDAGVAEAARQIRARLDCDAVLVTRGERGMMLLEDGEPVYVPTAAREVYDVTGAGDTVIATLALAVAAGATLTEAANLANHAAGIVVGKVGTATVSAEELLQSFASEN